MGTIHKRLLLYCHRKHKALPTPEMRQELGRVVIAAWFDKDNELNKCAITRIWQREPQGMVQALSYPRKFYPVIDSKIHALFEGLKQDTAPSKRKRIPVKKAPVYSVKNPPAKVVKEQKPRFTYRIDRA